MRLDRASRTGISETHIGEYLNRREFLRQLAVVSGGTVAAYALLAQLGSRRARGQIVAADDPRLDVGYVVYPGATGDIRAYSARPVGGEELPGVIVIHENTGLQPHIEDVARRFALEGFHAIAPDALSPVGGTPASTSQATSLINQLNAETTTANFVAAVQYLKTHPLSTGKVGCTGFCWGGAVTNQVAVHAPDLRAAVPFYGRQPVAQDVPKIRASLLCHYGALDTSINAGIEAFETALRAAAIDYGIYIHKGAGHAFFNDSRPDRYHEAAADLAWRLTLAFFRSTLRDDRLVAHYRLDEMDGPTAKDSAGANDGTLHGTPLWRPSGGRIKGAIQLDGIDDYIGAGFVLDPASGPFSVFAWVQGGGPGQVIVSQIEGANWLATDAVGRLMTGLSQPAGGRQVPSPLASESTITDGQWHHVGVVWDEMKRALYLDDVLVREDSQPSLAGSLGGVNIGCGATPAPGAFFAGLIDDVRIYNQAVRP
jgi:carboxymethylenebutenolidase